MASAPGEDFDVGTGWINFNARQYLYYLGFTGRLQLDWGWLFGVGVLKPWGIGEALDLPLVAQTDALLDRAIELGLVIKNCRQRGPLDDRTSRPSPRRSGAADAHHRRHRGPA